MTSTFGSDLALATAPFELDGLGALLVAGVGGLAALAGREIILLGYGGDFESRVNKWTNSGLFCGDVGDLLK